MGWETGIGGCLSVGYTWVVGVADEEKLLEACKNGNYRKVEVSCTE